MDEINGELAELNRDFVRTGLERRWPTDARVSLSAMIAARQQLTLDEAPMRTDGP